MKKFAALFLAMTMMFGIVPSGYAAYQQYASKTLITWCLVFNEVVSGFADSQNDDVQIDFTTTNGAIIYDENSFTYGPATGVGVIHGGNYSHQNTVTLGVGTGLEENENYWYASLSFSPEATVPTVSTNAFALIAAGLYMSGREELMNNQMITETFLEMIQWDNIALQVGDVVMVHKRLSGERHLFAVDSLAYYDEFYYNDTENYFVYDDAEKCFVR